LPSKAALEDWVNGVVSRTTAHRTLEIGIRIALGATVREVMVMVLTSGK
jgi:hypothetical protein